MVHALSVLVWERPRPTSGTPTPYLTHLRWNTPLPEYRRSRNSSLTTIDILPSSIRTPQLPTIMSSHELTALSVHHNTDKAEVHFSNEISLTQTNPPPKPNARPTVFRTTIHEILFVFIATMGVAMPSLLQGCTIVISSSVKRELNMSTTEITWMTASSA